MNFSKLFKKSNSSIHQLQGNFIECTIEQIRGIKVIVDTGLRASFVCFREEFSELSATIVSRKQLIDQHPDLYLEYNSKNSYRSSLFAKCTIAIISESIREYEFMRNLKIQAYPWAPGSTKVPAFRSVNGPNLLYTNANAKITSGRPELLSHPSTGVFRGREDNRAVSGLGGALCDDPLSRPVIRTVFRSSPSGSKTEFTHFELNEQTVSTQKLDMLPLSNAGSFMVSGSGLRGFIPFLGLKHKSTNKLDIKVCYINSVEPEKSRTLRPQREDRPEVHPFGGEPVWGGPTKGLPPSGGPPATNGRAGRRSTLSGEYRFYEIYEHINSGVAIHSIKRKPVLSGPGTGFSVSNLYVVNSKTAWWSPMRVIDRNSPQKVPEDRPKGGPTKGRLPLFSGPPAGGIYQLHVINFGLFRLRGVFGTSILEGCASQNIDSSVNGFTKVELRASDTEAKRRFRFYGSPIRSVPEWPCIIGIEEKPPVGRRRSTRRGEDFTGEFTCSGPKSMEKISKRKVVWAELYKFWRTNAHLRGFILNSVNGGYAVAIAGYIAFLPKSLCINKKVFIGQWRQFVIINMNPKIANIVVKEIGTGGTGTGSLISKAKVQRNRKIKDRNNSDRLRATGPNRYPAIPLGAGNPS